MSLQNTGNEKVLDIIKDVLLHMDLFSRYSVSGQNVTLVKSPTVITYYDTQLASSHLDRWIFFRIEDYYKKQHIVFYINFLHNKKPVNFNLEHYIYSTLKIHKVKNEFSFKANTQLELIKSLSTVLSFIEDNMDEGIERVLNGTGWIDMDFDWLGYK